MLPRPIANVLHDIWLRCRAEDLDAAVLCKSLRKVDDHPLRGADSSNLGLPSVPIPECPLDSKPHRVPQGATLDSSRDDPHFIAGTIRGRHRTVEIFYVQGARTRLEHGGHVTRGQDTQMSPGVSWRTVVGQGPGMSLIERAPRRGQKQSSIRSERLTEHLQLGHRISDVLNNFTPNEYVGDLYR